jgi:hypothetical protein
MRLIVVAPSVRSMAAGSGFTSRLLRGLCACGHFVKCFSEPLEVWRGHCTCRSGTTREGVTRPLVAIDGQLLTAMSTWLRCCVECLGELCPRAQQGKTCKPMASIVAHCRSWPELLGFQGRNLRARCAQLQGCSCDSCAVACTAVHSNTLNLEMDVTAVWFVF